jgi:hypothetical protein
MLSQSQFLVGAALLWKYIDLALLQLQMTVHSRWQQEGWRYQWSQMLSTHYSIDTEAGVK